MIAKCCVCDGEFDSARAFSRLEDEESTLFFCSEHCRQLFDETPEDYLDQEAAARRAQSLFVEMC